MKHNFAKVVGLALVASMTLTGCNLIEVDAVMQAQEDMAKVTKAYSVDAATYDGGSLTVDEVVADFNTQYSYMYTMYQYYLGMTLTDDQITEIAEDTIQTALEEEIVAQHFDDEGGTLTEEQQAEVDSTVEEEYEEFHTEALESATGKNDEAKEANAQVALAKVGETKEQLTADQLRAKKAEAEKAKLQDSITEVTDEELQTAYDEQLASDKETYDADPAAYGTTMTSADDTTVVAYVPEGYRTVRHILVIPEESVLTAYTDAKTALTTAQTELSDLQTEMSTLESAEDTTGLRTAEEIQADIDAANATIETCTADVETARQACLDNVSAKTTEIYEKLAAGTSFADVMAEYGEDPGMQDEATAQKGYYVCSASTNWQTEFTEGAMALEKVGDYSAEPVVSGSGVHIIEYYSDVTPGEVALDDIHDALYAKTLETKKTEYCNNTVSEWVAAVNPVYHADVLVSAVTTINS